MGVEFGGAKAWKVKSYGEIAAAFHWINNEPALCLFPTNAAVMRHAMVYILPLAAAHELVKDGTGGVVVDSHILWEKAQRATRVMGFGEDFFIAKRIADAILNSLDDLCDMPPEPAILVERAKPAPTGEVAFKVAGETVLEAEV